MGLTKLTDRIYFLAHDPEVDRVMLAYIKGNKYSLAIDVRYSTSYVKEFFMNLKKCI